MRATTTLIALALGTAPAWGAVDQLRGTPLGQWIANLYAAGTKERCCDTADGEDVYWEGTPTGGYRVMLFGKMVDVPPDAIVTEPNELGRALIFLMKEFDDKGNIAKYRIRCFLPGAAY